MKTPVGLLSGGQRQAVSLLMCTMTPPKLLLLDEHTAALDPATADKVLQITQEIVQKHRITTLMNADQILVLDHGRVSQLGTHQQLIAQEGIYKRIYEMQGASGSGDEA